MSDYIIGDGDPFWQSPCIWVRQDDPVPGWNPTSYDPPGEYQNPVSGKQNRVYVRVQRVGSFEADEWAHVHLWVGRGGPHFEAANLLATENDAPPVDVSGDTDWALVLGNRVIRLRAAAPPPVERLYHTVDPVIHPEYDPLATDPATTGWYWYVFPWEDARLPPPTTVTGWHPCLLAYVESNKDATSGNVPTDDNLAQRNICVEALEAGGCVKRKVMLGNQHSASKRIGVVIWREGPAARGSTVLVKFLRPKTVSKRLAFPEKLPFKVGLSTQSLRRRLPRGLGLPLLQDIPSAWGVKPTPGGLLNLNDLQGGFTIPVETGELVEVQLEIHPGPGSATLGRWMTVHLAESLGNGHVAGGVSFTLHVKA